MPNPPQDVAILRLDNLGDAILTTGFLTSLRQLWPSARITVFCSAAAGPLFSRCPAINGAVPLPLIPPKDRTSTPARANLQKFQELFRGTFDLLINPRCAPDHVGAGLYASASDAPERIAFRQKDFIEGFDPNACYTRLIDMPRKQEHPALVTRHILEHLGSSNDPSPPQILIGRRAQERARTLVGSKRAVAFAPGAALAYKIWPPGHFAQVVSAMAQRGWRVIVLGAPADRALTDRLKAATRVPVVDLVGQTSVEETAAVIAKCALFIGNDSGPKHIAAAVGTPVVDIGWLGASTPGFEYDREFAPFSVQNMRLSPDGEFSAAQTVSGAAIQSIQPEQVMEAADALIARGR